MKTTGKSLIAAVLLLLAGVAQADEATTPTYEQPILITSAGLSADVKLVGMLAKKQELNATVVNDAKAADLEGIKTLVMVPGFSSKGLGAAGVSQKDETDRVAALLAAAKEKGIPVVTVHVGGSARRGGQSDAFNKMAAEASKHMIVVAQGNEDKFFSQIADSGKIPLQLVDKIAEAAAPLGSLFKK